MRISEHRSNIRNHDTKVLSPCTLHRLHSVSALHYCSIEAIKPRRRGSDVKFLLLKREAFWIYTLGTLAPHGLNEDSDLRPFL